MRRDIVQDKCVCADDCAVSDFDGSEDCGAGTDEYVIADNRNLMKAPPATDRHVVRDLTVFSDDRASVNDNAHSVIVEGSVAADNSRVRDGCGKDKPHEIVKQSGKDRNVPRIECVATLVQREHLAHDL